jgi:hypothetical protein
VACEILGIRWSSCSTASAAQTHEQQRRQQQQQQQQQQQLQGLWRMYGMQRAM